MFTSNKHSTLKGLLLTLRAWSLDALKRRPYKLPHKIHGRPDRYKDVERTTIRRCCSHEEPPCP